jgi:hypothetical protein
MEESDLTLLREVVVPFQEKVLSLMKCIEQMKPMDEEEKRKWRLYIHCIKVFNFIEKFPDIKIPEIIETTNSIVNPEPLKVIYENNSSMKLPMPEPTQDEIEVEPEIDYTKFKDEDFIPTWTDEEKEIQKSQCDSLNFDSLNIFNSIRRNDKWTIIIDSTTEELNIVDEIPPHEEEVERKYEEEQRLKEIEKRNEQMRKRNEDSRILLNLQGRNSSPYFSIRDDSICQSPRVILST